MPPLSKKFNPLLKSYPESEKINSVSEGAEILYVRLLAASDDSHRYYGDASWVLHKLFTARAIKQEVDANEIERRLAELECSKPAPLIKRYWVGQVRYLELLGCIKVARADVNPQVFYPGEFTESGSDTGHELPETVPPTSTPTSTVTTTSTTTSTSTSTREGVDGGHVGVDGDFNSSKAQAVALTDLAKALNWSLLDWKKIFAASKEMAHSFPARCRPLPPGDAEEIVKVQALLAAEIIGMEMVSPALAKANRRSTENPFAAFHSVLGEECKSVGLNVNQLFKFVKIPQRKELCKN